LAIDLGSRRIGLAVSDPRRSMAFPHSVIERFERSGADRAAIAAEVQETGATTVVVGLPLSLDGPDVRPPAPQRAAGGEKLADASWHERGAVR